MENDEQRAIRRGISHWLTAKVNDVGIEVYANVRAEIINALYQLDGRFSDLNNSLKRSYHLQAEKDLVGFYMKGGNAYAVAISPDETSGGDSDWDTQVVIDPWAPIPIQEIVHGRLEDIVLDQLTITANQVAAKIALGFGDSDFKTKIIELWDAERRHRVISGKDLSNYELSLDDPQTVRRVFDHEKLGLWLYESTGLKSRNPEAPSKWMPGLIFNDSIGPFILIRLGYTWHVDLIDAPDHEIPENIITKPILMELIDVTIPRRNTVEGVAVWEEIETGTIELQAKTVSINEQAVLLPFPDIFYHLREQLDMICEVADGSSRHQDKLRKRFERLNQIYNYDNSLEYKNKVKDTLSQHVGVDSIEAEYEKLQSNGKIQLSPRIYNIINSFSAEKIIPFQLTIDRGDYWASPADYAYQYGLVMVNLVESAFRNQSAMFAHGLLTPKAAHKFHVSFSNRLTQIMSHAGCDVANSSDFILMEILNTNAYLKLNEIGLSGIFKSAIARVRNSTQLNHLLGILTSEIQKKAPRGLSEKHELYNTVRQNGLSYEFVMVVFSNSKACQIITATTATSEDLSFRSRGQQRVAPLVEIARQRKMAASLIEDYNIRTALSRQYEACKEIVNLSTN